MRLVFDVDLEKDNLDEKLRHLKDLENAIEMRIRSLKMNQLRSDGEDWLKSLPEKYF